MISLLQLIYEVYHLMKDALGMNTDEMSGVPNLHIVIFSVLVCLLLSSPTSPSYTTTIA